MTSFFKGVFRPAKTTMERDLESVDTTNIGKRKTKSDKSHEEMRQYVLTGNKDGIY